MPLRRDFAAARRLVRNVFVSRRNRARANAEREQFETVDPSSLRVLVYYADGPVNLYQVRQWLAPLEQLAKRVPVGIVVRSPGTALKLWRETSIPVLLRRQVVDLERLAALGGVRIVLYVNQNPKNFQMMRYGRMWHVFINHGESDKMYMTTNQIKAYDAAFIAGDAARSRLSRAIWDYDLDARTFSIGRPQVDHFAGDAPYPADDRTVVLYMPTWEGDRPTAAYGSIATHGVELTKALLADAQYRLVYRPHPRSGVLDPAYKRAHEQIVQAIERANQRDPGAHHVYDQGSALGWQLVSADIAVSDISAMIYDRIATGKPLIVTRPANPEATIDDGGYLSAATWLEAGPGSDMLETIDATLSDDDARAQTAHWASYYFGDTTPGSATSRFEHAIDVLLARWDEHEARHRGDEPLTGENEIIDESFADDEVDELPDER